MHAKDSQSCSAPTTCMRPSCRSLRSPDVVCPWRPRSSVQPAYPLGIVALLSSSPTGIAAGPTRRLLPPPSPPRAGMRARTYQAPTALVAIPGRPAKSGYRLVRERQEAKSGYRIELARAGDAAGARVSWRGGTNIARPLSAWTRRVRERVARARRRACSGHGVGVVGHGGELCHGYK
jgi:hypothetical protein